MEPTKTSGSGSGKRSRLRHMEAASSSASPAAKVFSMKQKVEELPRSPQLIGRIVEKGFSSSDSSSVSPSPLPQPTVLPFPVARHRSHGPHWSPAKLKKETNEEDMNIDKDETNYNPLSSIANPVERKEKKGIDFSMWKELISNDDSTSPQIKKRVIKSTPKASKRDIIEMNVPLKEDIVIPDMNKEEEIITKESSQNPEPLSLKEEIEAENLARLNEMSTEEISEAQTEIMEKMDPKLVEMLKKRAKRKLEKNNDSKSEKNSETKRENLGVTPGDWFDSRGNSNFSWKSWSDRVEKSRVCRFSLDGDFLGFDGPKDKSGQYNYDGVAERDFLRTEGDPSSIGYTIHEAVSLTRSVIPGQRALALQLLSSIFNKALQNLEKDEGISEKSVDWQAIWAFSLGPEPQIALSLRIAMDDNHDSVVLACARTILSYLSHDMNEAYFEASEKLPTQEKDVYTAPVFRTRPELEQGFIKGGFWKYNTKPSNLLPDFGENENEEGEDEKVTVKDDMVVAGQDVAAGLIRMSLLPRICYLLEMDPNQNLEETLVSILVALARHSPQSARAILSCPRLVQNVAKFLNNQRMAEIHSSSIKALTLFMVLSKFSKQTCLDFIKNGIFQMATWRWYSYDITLEKWINSQTENLELSSRLIIEQLRFWRVYINYGLCIFHFTDFFSFLCLFLSPPIFEKLIDVDALVEFTSITTEAYLVLNALSQKLPVLHNSNQIGSRKENLERESWSWSHAVPMVDLAIKWLESKSIPVLSSVLSYGSDRILAEGIDTETLNSFLWVFSSIFHMLNSILEKVAPVRKAGSTETLPWLPDFVPRLGLALINNKYGSLFTKLNNLRNIYENKNIKNYDVLLASTSCMQGLLRVSLSIDKLIHRAKASCTGITGTGVTGGEILETGIINRYREDLSEFFSMLTLTVSSEWRLVQSTEIFGRGGPAPGVGFGWGSPGGGFWSVRSVLTRLDSSLLLDFVDIFPILPPSMDTESNYKFTPDGGILKRIGSMLELCLLLGPGDRIILEKAIDNLLENSVLKYLASCINYSVGPVELKFSEEELLIFSNVLISNFKARWLDTKKRKSTNEDTKKLDSLETIHEEIELNEDSCLDPFGDSMIEEWAHQRLPVPTHWILSSICCTGRTQNSGLFLLLGLESVSSISDSIPSISEITLVWKLHSLSFCLYANMDVLGDEKSRGIFDILQGIYSREMEKVQSLDFQGEISENYSTFLENLIEQFSAVSYGDALYGRQVAAYLHNKVETKLRLNAWKLLHSNSVLELLPPLENCLGGPNGYLGPIEDNDAILEAYVKSWISGGLDRAAKRKSMAFTLVSYHLSRFIFQTGTSEKQTLRNRLAKSLLRYYSQKPQNEEMLKAFVETGLDVSQEQLCRDEIARRFQVLKDCCEGNSSLLVEVEKLRSSISS